VFFERLRAILFELGVNGGNLEEGHLRCDANVSLRRPGDTAFGAPVEVKNLNSFRYLERALDHEIGRQAAVLEGGGRVARETRLYDVATGRTVVMRSKEQADDYRYFPEPDLPPLAVASERIEAMRALLPELPDARHRRFVAAYGLSEYDAGQVAATPASARFFEQVAARSGNPKAAANWMTGELTRRLKAAAVGIESAGVTADALGELIALVDAGTIISTSLARQVFDAMWGSGRRAAEVVAAQGLTRIDDAARIEAIVREVVAANPGPVAQFKAGKTLVFGFFVGQVMKATRGQADPERVNALVRRELDRA
jgi:aspartyl-tRNA(Asn)/glutamyl-tRNA(Gln) amidotransferase subunit B